MTDRETRLRARIDELTDQRDEALARCRRFRRRYEYWRTKYRAEHPPPRTIIDGHEHGKRWTYNLGCRCKACRHAEARYERQRGRFNTKAGTGSNLDGPGPVPAEGAHHA